MVYEKKFDIAEMFDQLKDVIHLWNFRNRISNEEAQAFVNWIQEKYDEIQKPKD